MKQWGTNYWETYASVVNWISTTFLLILSEIAGLETLMIDFVLDFLQDELYVPVYMELPVGMEVDNTPGECKPEERKPHVLCLQKFLYELKQASAN